MPRLRIVAFSVVALCISTASLAQTGSLRGVAIDHETGIGLPHASVTVLGTDAARLTNASGEFMLSELPDGDVRLRVRHIGFAPVDTTVHVRGGAVVDVRVSLAHVAIQLEAVRSTSMSECTTGGLPVGMADSSLTVAYHQLEQNALQYRLLANEYPFRSIIERVFANLYDRGGRQITRRDTLQLSSKGLPDYQVGQVVQRRAGSYSVAIPTLTVFADSAFIRAHCFTSAGASKLRGIDVLQIDFRALEGIRTPDINGAIYLDARTFMVRRSVVWLSRTNGPVAAFDSLGITTDYAEIAAGVPVIERSTAENHYRILPRVPSPPVAVEENHHLLAVHFLGPSPFAADSARGPGAVRRDTITDHSLRTPRAK